ncbi:related to ATE1-Arginyl tRNA transferase [Zygosaccharomyces bailii ISA1307]|nr:related to ATE1-Arginyl tRNA transferase [Zygosaccharomyces bailii ISA1307]
MTERLVVSEPYYFTEPMSHCGYCKGKKPKRQNNFSLQSWYNYHSDKHDNDNTANCTMGVQVELMSVEMYDKLCNMGFRRSGRFLYKPDLLRNCCRLYTIRTTAEKVHISKDIKSCVKRFKKAVTAQQTTKGRGTPYNYMKEIVEAENDSQVFHTRFEPAFFSEEKYKLFAKYQERVHDDHDHSPKSFKRFLCDSPFSPDVQKGTKQEWDQLNGWKNSTTEYFKRLGPAHECYFYEDKLIALAVIDILPSGISSVYFIWDPDYHKWSLGKLSALRELTICSKINRKFYYMGYYIDDCPKMNYKGHYGGELMDICNFKFAPLEFLQQYIEDGNFFVLSDESDLNDEPDLNDRLTKHPTTWQELEKLHNVAENIYGFNGKAFSTADKAADRLSQQEIPYRKDAVRDICHQNTNKKDIYRIPNVAPGLLPLHEIADLVSEGKFDLLNNRLLLFDTTDGRIRPMARFTDESPQIKKAICNLVRLFGLQNTRDALLII